MFTRGRNRSNRRQPIEMLRGATAGLHNELTVAGGTSLSWAGNRTGDVALISGLSGTYSLDMAVPYYIGGLPAINAHLYTPKPEGMTPFAEEFGLTPVVPAAAGGTASAGLPGAAPVSWTVAERLASQLDARVQQAEAEGLALFRAATIERRDPRTGGYRNCPDCARQLQWAVQRLTLVRDLNEHSHVASVLLAHASLEREQPTLATLYLLDAYERDPAAFTADPGALNQYFGDTEDGNGESPTLRAQLDRYLRIASLNAASAEACLLSAYCAWRLGDAERMRESAAAAAELARRRAADNPEHGERILRFVDGLGRETVQAGSG